MPSAQHVEIDQPSRTPAAGDLYSLLRELKAANGRNLSSLHRRGSVLFSEGELARGVCILHTGRATVSISSSEGRVVILRMVRAGEVLGLNAVLRNSTYDATVRTLEPSRVNFISRGELMELVQSSEAGTNALLQILSHELTQLNERTKSLLLPQTASAKLAKLLLECGNGSLRFDRVFTHEEIAQMICAARETVTRLLTDMSRRNIVLITSDSILIRDRAALERMALGVTKS